MESPLTRTNYDLMCWSTHKVQIWWCSKGPNSC